MCKKNIFLLGTALFLLSFKTIGQGHATIIMAGQNSPRVQFGADKLIQALTTAGYTVSQSAKPKISPNGISILIGEWNNVVLNQFITKNNILFDKIPGKEGFSIKSAKNLMVIRGADASGTLYGCLELADRLKTTRKLPVNIDVTDQPEMVMRGACIGLQKTTYLPGRTVYEYPYTPETFPWFYDKNLWIKYLDMLVANRMNSLYLWNGHPFASLVKVKEYPYAVEVDDETFRKNEEIYAFLTEEANKRGIWVIQMFYNIIVSKPFAEHNNLKTQDRSRPIVPVIADYTKKSIAAFVEKYPNVGLLVCLGEAMNTEEDDVEWLTKTIIPGVKDGIKALGRTDEPPIILRAHDTNAQMDMAAALPMYKNLYTMHKYNGESLTTYEPRGPWSKVHQDLSSLGSIHIENVHILANLEPFRYASPDFIQKSVQAMHKVHGANGLHLYPQASYWDWPYTADNTSPRLLQIDRDQMWYQTWARYAWNCNRDRKSEVDFYTRQLGEFYGCGEHGREILEAYEQSGEIAPKLLRRFGITDGNRQTLLLGMFMSQLVNPYKYRVYSTFYESNGPVGEILVDYANKEWKKQPHIGETPPQIVSEVINHGKSAMEAIDKAAPYVKYNVEEFNRLKNDMHCYNAFANCFAEKVNAAMLVLRYKNSNDVADLEKALSHIEKSVGFYKTLVELTKGSYLYANSMQTQQRRIPVGGDDGKNKTWEELLPQYQEELAKFRKNVEMLKTSVNKDGASSTPKALLPVNVTMVGSGCEWYNLSQGEKPYVGENFEIKSIAPEIQNLRAIRLSSAIQEKEGTEIRFVADKPVKVLVGYFNGSSRRILAAPSLETDASANDRGQGDIKLANALDIPGLFPVNIYSYSFDKGENTLKLGKGIALILGFIDGSQTIAIRDAGLGSSAENGGIDWLFY
jgi:hypothetical protein